MAQERSWPTYHHPRDCDARRWLAWAADGFHTPKNHYSWQCKAENHTECTILQFLLSYAFSHCVYCYISNFIRWKLPCIQWLFSICSTQSVLLTRLLIWFVHLRRHFLLSWTRLRDFCPNDNSSTSRTPSWNWCKLHYAPSSATWVSTTRWSVHLPAAWLFNWHRTSISMFSSRAFCFPQASREEIQQLLLFKIKKTCQNWG